MKAAALAVALAACTPEYVAQGEHHQYVAASVRMPTTAGDATNFAVFLGNQRANKVGAAFAGHVPLAITQIQAMQLGRSSLLLDVQANGFDAATAAGVSISYGEDPTPSPCNGPPPGGCGQHLKGGATFGIVLDNPPTRSTTGTIRGGTLFSDPAEFAVELSFDGMSTITVPFLIGRFELKQISDDRIVTGIIGGAIALEFVQDQLIDHMQGAFNQVLDRDCVSVPGGGCNCNVGSAGKIISEQFDNGDCLLDRVELASSQVVRDLLAGDIAVQGIPAVSFGIEITATSASF